MTWRDKINNGNGSFRDVPFRIDNSEKPGHGRNTLVHEYPGRAPYPEDNGPAPKRFKLDLVVIGDDYLDQAEKLEKALDTPGPGILYIPLWGRINVSALPYSRSDNSRRGGMAEFRVEFIKWENNKNPKQNVNTAGSNSAAVDLGHLGNIEALTEDFSVLNAVGWVKNAAESDLESVLGELNTLTDALVPSESLDFATTILNNTLNDAVSLIGLPGQLGQQLTGVIVAIASAGAGYGRLFNTFDALYPSTSGGGTVNQGRADKNETALKTFAQRSLLMESSRVLSGGQAFEQTDTDIPLMDEAVTLSPTAFGSSNEAVDTLDQVLERSDALMDVETNDEAFTALQSVSTTLAIDIRKTVAQLPEIRSYTPVDSASSLTLAYLLYGDTLREDDILERNPVEDPGFLIGGQALEVLSV